MIYETEREKGEGEGRDGIEKLYVTICKSWKSNGTVAMEMLSRRMINNDNDVDDNDAMFQQPN